MSCYHPLRAFKIGINPETNKSIMIIESGECERIHAPKSIITSKEQYKLNNIYLDKWITEYQEVPCGRCIGCRLEYSRQWATRCMLESEQYKENQFITLTYDNEHIPITNGVTDDGEIGYVGTLNPDDLQKFMKRLRIKYKRKFNHDNIRFYACGEYGEEHQRPHYHAIIFNLPIPDKKEWYINQKSHEKVYTSEILTKIWGKGIVGIGNVTWESAAYVARYIMKKQKGQNAIEYYKKRGIHPEFVRMSRKPGIAAKYYEDHKFEIYETDEIFIKRKNKVEKVKPSKYYDDKFDIEFPEEMKEIKSKRQELAIKSMELNLTKTSLTKKEYMNLKERSKEECIKKLLRTMHT